MISNRKEVVFITQSRTTGNHIDSPLTLQGIEDGVVTGRALRKKGILGVHSSSAPGALTAAQVLTMEIGLPNVDRDPLLNPRTQTIPSNPEEHEEWKKSFTERDSSPSNGIPVNWAAGRLHRAIDQLICRMAFVGHADSLAALLSDERYMGVVPDELTDIPTMGMNGLERVLPPSSITEIVMGEGKLYVVGHLGSTEHLQK